MNFSEGRAHHNGRRNKSNKREIAITKKNLKLLNRCGAREWKWNDWERNSWKCLNHRERYLWTRSEKYWKDCERNSWKWLNQWRRSREWGSALELGAKQQNQTMPPPPWGSTGHGYIKDNGEENLTKHKKRQNITINIPKHCQRTQGIEYFDSFNTISSIKIKTSTSFEILVKLQFGLFFQRAWNTKKNFDKSMKQFREVQVLILTNPCTSILTKLYNNLEKSMYEGKGQGKAMIRLGSDKEHHPFAFFPIATKSN